MGLLIDSNVLVAAERGRLRLQDVLAGSEDESVAISVITASEMLHSITYLLQRRRWHLATK